MCLAWNSLLFQVTTENMETELWKLNVLEICLAVFAMIYVPLIPTWDEVREQQKHIKEPKNVIEEEELESPNTDATKIFKLDEQRSAVSNEEQ